MYFTNSYELECRYDARQSFYGKARVFENAKTNTLTLMSYDTMVAEIKNDKAKVWGTYSSTTLRHIREFLKQNGFKAETKAQIVKDYC